MIAARGKLQREGEVIHLIVEYLIDLTGLLRSISDREEPFSNAQTRVEDKSDDAERNGRALGKKARDINVRDLHIDRFKTKDPLKIKTRDFR
jgi:error-prone DNA polymerase